MVLVSREKGIDMVPMEDATRQRHSAVAGSGVRKRGEWGRTT